MSDLQTTAVNRAVTLLKAAGAQFAILHNDTKYGDLDVVEPRKPRTSLGFEHNKKHQYQAKIDAAQVGDVLTFQCDSEPEAKSLRGSISSYAQKKYGDGATITEYKIGKGMVVTALVVRK